MSRGEKTINRRNFIKILAGLPLIGSLPVLAKANEVNLDDYQAVTKMFNGDAFSPKDLPNLTMWQGFETDENGVTRYIDKLTGEDLSGNIKRFNDNG